MAQEMIYLVGAGIEGWEGFGKRALEVIGRADVLIGHSRHLELFSDFAGEKRELHELSEVLEFLRTTDQLVVLLASGDPNFFGIARFLLRNLPKERIEIFPNVTSVQYAFARIKEPWDDAIFVSVHGRGLKGAVDRIVAAEKSAVLTDEKNTPAVIAADLVERGAEGYVVWLCENLGLPDEKFTRTDVKGLLTLPAAALNIVIFIKVWEPTLAQYPLIGIHDDEFAAVKKLITKQEVRAVTLAKLRLQDDLTFWDVGAGSGSVSIEASNLLPNGKLFAIEKNPQALSHLRDNLKKFVARNVQLVEAYAPDGLEEIPDPDRVFIGGSGGNLEAIIALVDKRLRSDGVIVLNAVTLDTLTKAIEFFEDYGYEIEVVCINVSRTRNLTEYRMFEAQNPVYIITAWKENA